jgi:hypothetical protein
MKHWCVEAESAEEARELIAARAGYQCQIGDAVLPLGHRPFSFML